nr:MAG TPA: hypothetical protein [Caudoviricetes sp.]
MRMFCIQACEIYYRKYLRKYALLALQWLS